MRRRLVGLLLALALVPPAAVVAAVPASADVCKTYTSHWNFREGSVPLVIATIDTTHTVCVTRTGYTFRHASRDVSVPWAAASTGWTFNFSAYKPTQQSATFDGWTVYGSYTICVWKMGIQVCGPWGTFQVKHRIGKYDNSTSTFVATDTVVRTNTYSGKLRWSRT